MLYREVGEFKTSYAQDSQTFPIKFDRYRYYFVILVGILFVFVFEYFSIYSSSTATFTAYVLNKKV